MYPAVFPVVKSVMSKDFRKLVHYFRFAEGSVIQFLLVFIGLLPHCVQTLEQIPKLECHADQLELHFKPEKPFYGHIYVKGFFMSGSCHLDYTRNPLYHPFVFHVPYRSGCDVKREKQTNPPGINYHVVIVVQHHYLFLTQADRAYSVNCFYRENYNDVAQDVEVSALTPTELSSDEAVPICVYEVLKNSVNGEPVKYANIGDRLIHKWSCTSENYGMVVHSCLVRDPGGTVFQLIDDRGCITDHTLIDPLTYEDNRTVAHSLVPAFKFAEQLIVHFQCKITLCPKKDNGCEGITPPTCAIISQPSINPYELPPEEFEGQPEQPPPENVETAGNEYVPAVQPTPTLVPPPGEEGAQAGSTALGIELSGYTNEAENQSENGGEYNVNINASVLPEPNHIGYRRLRSVDKSRIITGPRFRKFSTLTNSTDPANFSRLTFDVNADQLIVFGRDEGNRGMPSEVSYGLCQVSRNWLFLQTAIFILLSLLVVSIIFVQKRFYDRRLLKCSSVPKYEMHLPRWQI